MISLKVPEDVFLETSKLLREHRISKNMTQKELSKRSGVSYSVLKNFEQTGKISLASFIKLLFILGLTEAFLKSLERQSNYETMDELLASNKAEVLSKKTISRVRKKKDNHG